EAIVAEPILRRLSIDEQAIVEAAALFNSSDGLRTIEGIARSLGEPRVSVVALSGPNPDVVLTFVWEISWYQYRRHRAPQQPGGLAARGGAPAERDRKSTGGTPGLERGSGVYPEIEPEG